MEKDFYDYIFNNRISGFCHPTREKTISLFYEIRNTRSRLQKPADYIFKQLDGDPGIFFADDATNLRYTLLNCCFYYCEFLLNSRVEHEPVYNSSDYFINKITKVQTEADAHALLASMVEAFLELSDRPEKGPYCSIVETCIRYINHELYSRLSLQDIAKHVCRTPQYLTTLFKKKQELRYTIIFKTEKSKKQRLC